MKTVNMDYSSGKGKEYPKGDSEVIRVATPIIGPKLMAYECGWQLCVLRGKMLPLGFQRTEPPHSRTA